MEKQNENLFVLFASISESARIYERLGDEAATDLIQNCLSLMHQTIQEQMGDVVSTIRDKVDCIFWDAVSAVSAAKEMNASVDAYVMQTTGGQPPVNLHIGIHSGPVQMAGDKIYGDTVNVVTRVTQMAKPREILVSETVFNELGGTLKSSTHRSAYLTVQGSETPLELYEFVWEDYDTTVAIGRDQFSRLKQPRSTCLELRRQDQVYEISSNNPRLYLGRQSQNDIVAPAKSVSRFHAFIELRDGHFVLSDNSSNGTFVYPHDAEPVQVKQKEAYLEAAGAFSLGEDCGADAVQAIQYRVKDAAE